MLSSGILTEQHCQTHMLPAECPLKQRHETAEKEFFTLLSVFHPQNSDTSGASPASRWMPGLDLPHLLAVTHEKDHSNSLGDFSALSVLLY